MPTANEEILDATIRHTVWLERLKSGEVKRIVALLNKADNDLVNQITARLAKIEKRGYDLGPATTERLKKLLAEIREQRKAAYAAAYDLSQDGMLDFAKYEADYQASLIETAGTSVGVDLAIVQPTVAQLKAVVSSQPFQGRILKDWFSDLSTTSAARVSDAVKIGITEGQTIDQIVRRIRGTKAKGFADGILAIDRRNAESVVRTAVAHVANRAKETMFEENTDIIEGVKWVAVIDGRTTPQCRANDGKIFPVGKGPRPPLHFGCRSVTIAYLGPTKIKGTRASAIGPVPDDMTYGEWLKKQSASIQDDILGKSKGKLFRNGLPIDRFVDASGKEYTLKDLKKRDAEIYKKTFKE